MIKYKIVYSAGIKKLERNVEDMIAEGWRLCGGVAFDSEGFLYQAMSKKVRKERSAE